MSKLKNTSPLDDNESLLSVQKIKTGKELLEDAKDILQHNWEEVKTKISERWAEFTTHDIIMMKGKVEELCLLLQKKYLYSKDHAEQEIHKFIKDHGWKRKSL